MAIIVGVPRETMPGERRVALTPRACEGLAKSGVEVIVEKGAGVEAGYTDAEYQARGVKLGSRDDVFASAAIIAQVRTLGANPEAGKADTARLRKGQLVIGLGEPLTAFRESAEIAGTGAMYFALELVPRITRAQSMDVLSSMASVAGYKAVLMAAAALPKMFPMMTTAAGTISPAKVLVIGAGVAGLQALATARRLGSVVSGYDVRAAAKEQVESLGAKFVVLDLDTGAAEGTGGYAKAMDEAFYKRQRELLTAVIKEQDVLITTAAVPGKAAPILVTKEMLAAMAPGSVVLDLAAERGGNCEGTKPGEVVEFQGIKILGPVNIPSSVPFHASQMFAFNTAAFLKLIVVKGELKINPEDEIIRETLVTKDGQVVNARCKG